MGGGLMQLVAYGAQDIYLTGNPQITFFKVVYRRHTNFAMESIAQVFSGNVNFGKKTSCTIARNGDLIGKMYLEIDLGIETVDNEDLELGDRIGHRLIDYVEVEIGGQAIDKHYGEWLDLWTQLSHSEEESMKLERLVSGNIFKQSGSSSGNANNTTRKLYVPLQFWFNRNPGLALPLIALQYHEVKINLQLHHANTNSGFLDLQGNSKVSLENICLFCDYIFLDTDERRRFAQVSHEYLIEQVQFNGKNHFNHNETVANIELRLNHPCKELIWLAQLKPSGTFYGTQAVNALNNKPYPKSLNYSNNNNTDIVEKAVLQLNGHDRFREREGSYFRLVQPYQHHKGALKQNQSHGFFYVYSFALKPEDHQPSGTCNFSRIDNALLTLQLSSNNSKQVRVYATNYNVLRIMSGMGGLAYSN